MIEAIIISMLAVFLAWLNGSSRFKYGLECAFILVTAFLCIGYEWGNDVPTYEAWFEDFSSTSLSYSLIMGYTGRVEPGWIILNSICGGIGFYGMRAVLFVFENFVIYRLIKSKVPTSYYWLAMFIYCFNPYFMVLGSSMMRQWLAMCIVVVAVWLLSNNKFLLSLSMLFFAFTIHRSSIISLPIIAVYYLNKKGWLNNINFKSLFWIIPLYLIYVFSFSDLFGGLIYNMLEGELSSYTGYTDRSTTHLFGPSNLILMVLYVYMLLCMRKEDINYRLYYLVLCLYLFTIPFQLFSDLASRMSLYFTIFSIMAIPLFLSKSDISNAKKNVIAIYIVLFYFYQTYLFFSSPVYLPFINYKMITF